ncbi:MAG: helix-turn-helix transcriptional regulator [Fimbriimonadaceae bacterium]|nr:helix-turn-helix transcriptional regulator [Fimbriimonadaceae bacterium]QYK56816.1 MAG: helix-turn-helix transcriptional regulator [Fimbriimonadaceae bacterium]
MACQGLSDRLICDRLQIKSGTLGTYWSRIRLKTGLTNRSALSAAFARSEVVDSLSAVIGSLVLCTLDPDRNGTFQPDGAGRSGASPFGSLPVSALVLSRDGIVAFTEQASKQFSVGFGGHALHNAFGVKLATRIMDEVHATINDGNSRYVQALFRKCGADEVVHLDISLVKTGHVLALVHGRALNVARSNVFAA